MNKVILVGNLTKNPEQKTTQSGIAVTSFTVAVQRKFKSQSGEREADFINCVAWRSTAEFIAKYFSKGSRIGVAGSIQTRSYDDQNGNRRYVTEVVVDEAEFVTSKGQGAPRNAEAPTDQESRTADELFADELSDFQPLDDAELPF